jgi:hypothetical protein
LDPHGQEFKEITNERGIQKSKMHSNRDAKSDKPEVKKEQFDELMSEAKKNEGKIVKMQANVRGFLSRKANKQQDFLDPKPMLSKRSNKKMPGGGIMGDKGRPIL